MENEQGIIPKNTDKKVKNEMNKFKIKWREKKVNNTENIFVGNI